MLSSRLNQFLAGALAVLFFGTNVLFASAPEVNFWAERRDASRRTMRSAGASSGGAFDIGVTADRYQILAQLPKVGQVTWGAPQSVSSVGVGLVLPGSFSAGNALDLPLPSSDTPGWIANLILPYGSIRDVHIANKPNAPLIVHVQDAHGIEEAQKNIAAIIQGLSESRGVNLVGLEAAQGPFNLDPYRNWPNEAVTREVAEYFLKVGKIGGVEYAGITAPNPLTLWGIENEDLYLANVQALKDANKLKPELTKVLANIKASVSALKETNYSNELKEFDRRFLAYQDQREGLGPYVRYLTGGAKVNNGAFPNLRLLVKALVAEDALDFKRVEQERLQMVEVLARKLPKQKLDLLVQRSFQYRAGQVGYGDYHRFLKALCRDHAIALGGTLAAYVEYVVLAEKIDRNKLLDELTRAERETEDRLAVTPAQKELVAVARRIALLEKLSTQSMTPEDWAVYEKERSHILKIVDDVAALSGAPDAGPPVSLVDLLTPAEAFCRNAVDRNEAFIENLKSQLFAQKARAAVLVAGGFHSDGLASLMRKKDLSYLVVTPKITEVPKENNYLDVFARDPLPLEKLFAGEEIFLNSPRLAGASGLGSDQAQKSVNSSGYCTKP
ncbi:MAG: hypothetical protein JNK54_06025 [Elusimicrobia bacterium]|nr:hypothetical protein [Elusimicrobiota bacterium]